MVINNKIDSDYKMYMYSYDYFIVVLYENFVILLI